MNYLQKLREDHPALERFSDDVLVAALPQIYPQTFGGLSFGEAREKALQERTVGGWAGAAGRGMASGAVGSVGSAVEGAGLIAQRLGADSVGEAVTEAGQRVSDYGAQIGPAPLYDSVATDVATGVGSMGTYLVPGGAAGLLTRGAGALARGSAGVAAASTMAGPSGVAEAYNRAIHAGLSEEEAVAESMRGFPAGVVQVAPVAVILRQVPPQVRGRALAQFRHVLESFGAEFTAEGAGAVMQNLVEQAYNPERGTWDDSAYQALIGGSAAAGIQTGLLAVTRGRGFAPGATTQRADSEQAAIDEIDRAGEQALAQGADPLEAEIASADAAGTILPTLAQEQQAGEPTVSRARQRLDELDDKFTLTEAEAGERAQLRAAIDAHDEQIKQRDASALFDKPVTAPERDMTGAALGHGFDDQPVPEVTQRRPGETPAQPQRANVEGIDSWIEVARRMGFAEEEARLRNAKRLYGAANSAIEAGDLRRAERLRNRANTIFEAVTGEGQALADYRANLPAPYVAEGEVMGASPTPVEQTRGHGHTVDMTPFPGEVTDQRPARLGADGRRLPDEGIVFGQEPGERRAHRQAKRAAHERALTGTIEPGNTDHSVSMPAPRPPAEPGSQAVAGQRGAEQRPAPETLSEAEMAELQRQRQRRERQAERRRVKPETDSLVTAAIKLGGLKPEWRQDITGDTRGNKSVPGVGWLFTPKGTSPDDLALKLHEQGYITREQMDDLDGRDFLYQAIRNELAGIRTTYALDSLKAQEAELEALEAAYLAEQEALEGEREAMYAELAAEHGADVAEWARQHDEGMAHYLDELEQDAHYDEQVRQQREESLSADTEPSITQAEAAARDEQIRRSLEQAGGQPGEVDRRPSQDRRDGREDIDPSQAPPGAVQPTETAPDGAVAVSGQGVAPFALEPETETTRREREARAEDDSLAQRRQADMERAHFSLTPGEGNASNIGQTGAQGDLVGAATSQGLDAPDASPTTDTPATPIEDFGEKIEGARKDYATKLKDAEDKDVVSVPLSEAWPEPDYQKMVDDGADSRAVALVRTLRDEVPNKPRKQWKVEGWAKQVRALRDAAMRVLNDPKYAARFNEGLDKHPVLAPVPLKAELYEAVGHEKSLKGIRFSKVRYAMLDGQHFEGGKEFWEINKAARASAFGNMPTTLARGETKEEVIEAFKKVHKSLDATTENAARKVRFDIYSHRHGDNPFFIAKKIGRDVVPIKEGFASAREARDHLVNNQAALEKTLEQMKDIPAHRKETNAPRVGADHRNGGDVTPEQFQEAFGFRGVQFGNYVEQGRRQKDLNRAYDALMDMAGILNLPPKALSLNGELGLAFGARGKGGKRAPAAHYERDRIVINLTKREGAGSLAHEWFHSVDNYFSRMKGRKGEMLTEDLSVANVSRGGKFHDDGRVRPEMIRAFGEIRRAVNDSSMRVRATKLDRMRTKAYWSTGPEMAARAFESYVIDKLASQGASNDYLANIVSKDYWEAAASLGVEQDGTYPYPEAADMPAIRAAFDHFFETVETKETEHGIALQEGQSLYSADERAIPPLQAGQRYQGVSETQATDAGRPAQFDLFTPPGTDKKQAYADLFGTVVKPRTVNHLKSGTDRINRAEDVAHLLASLRKDPQENFYAVATDKAGEVLRVMRFTRGTSDSSLVNPLDIVAEAASIAGIDTLHYAHNHPAGDPSPSTSDMTITDRINRMLDGTGINPGYHVVVGQSTWEGVASARGRQAAGGKIPAKARNLSVPVTERRFVKRQTLGEVITKPDKAKAALAGHDDVIMLLNTRHYPVGLIPMSPGEMARLRDGGRVNRVLSAIGKANANAAIIKTGDRDAAANMARFINSLGEVRLLDWIGPNETSAGETGDAVLQASGPFFSRGAGNRPSMGVDAVSRKAAEVYRRTGLEQGGASLEVVATEADLPQVVRQQAEKDGATGQVDGVYHNGSLYVVAAAVQSEAHVEAIIAHEALGHFGARQLFGQEITRAYNQLFSQLGGANGMSERLAKHGIRFDHYIDTANRLGSREQAFYLTDEFLAQMQQADVLASLPQKIQRKVRELYGALRDWLKRHGLMSLARFTDADLAHLLQSMRRAARGRAEAARAGTPHVMRGLDTVGGNRQAQEVRFSRGATGAAEPVGFSGPRIERAVSNFAKLRGWFESAADVLRRTPGLEPVGEAVRIYYDRIQANRSAVARPERRAKRALNELPRAERKKVLDAFARHRAALENGRHEAARRILARSNPALKTLVEAWREIADITGDMARKAGVMVRDARTGEYRPMGKVRDFWPRQFSEDVEKALDAPTRHPEKWNELVDAVYTQGNHATREEAASYLIRYRNELDTSLTDNDYFAGIERGRTEPLPELFYDYSWEGGLLYKEQWAQRLAQIQAFGQSYGHGPNKAKDLFDTTLEEVRDDNTRNYLIRVRAHAYNEKVHDPYQRIAQGLNTLATGIQLGNPATALLNLIGGTALTFQAYGIRRSLRALWQTGGGLSRFKNQRELAFELGILNEDYLQVLHDSERAGTPQWLRQFAGGALRYGGYTPAEHFIRTTNMVAGKAFLRDALKTLNTRPESKKAARYAKWFERNGFDMDRLLREGGEGGYTDRFIRYSVNLTQGSYKIDQTPLFVDSPLGRFLFKYQKFGTQLSRMFWMNHLKPFVDTLRGGEPVTYTIDGREYSQRLVNFMPLLRFFAVAAGAGVFLMDWREELFGYQNKAPTWDELDRALQDDETARAMALMAERALQGFIAVGGVGFFTNYYQFVNDVADRQRVKNPLSPPGLAPLEAMGELALRAVDQKELTARDVDTFAQQSLSFYRTVKRATATQAADLIPFRELEVQAAKADVAFVKKMTRRYAEDVGLEAKRRAPARVAATPNTPFNNRVIDAILVGDTARARALMRAHFRDRRRFPNQEERDNAMRSLKAAVRAREPSRVGVAPSERERRAFLRWARQHTTEEEFARIQRIADDYRRNATRAGLL